MAISFSSSVVLIDTANTSVHNGLTPFLGGGFSISCWFNARSFSSPATLFCRRATGTVPWGLPYASYVLRISSSTTMEASVGQLVPSSLYSNYRADVGITMAVDTWYHVGMTYDRTTVIAYFNGVRVGTDSTLISGDPYYTVNFNLIGADYSKNPYGGMFNGILSDIKFFNTAIGADDMLKIYNCRGKQNTVRSDALSAYYPLDDMSNNTTISGNIIMSYVSGDQPGGDNTPGHSRFPGTGNTISGGVATWVADSFLNYPNTSMS